MIGAIIGDIAGSRFEFNNYRYKNMKLFGGDFPARMMVNGHHKYDKCCFTDDTVMTCAVASALLKMPKMELTDEWEKQYKETLINSFKEWAKKYPNAGYGSRFIYWLFSDNRKPYNSYGNGSAMRTSPVIWYANTLEECEALATWTAEITHNHPEGIKGAVVTSVAGFMARTGAKKPEIAEYINKYYPTAGKMKWQQIAQENEHIESCMNALPIAMNAFLNESSYQNVIKEAIACGGDSDTIAAIAGAVAEAYYNVDSETMVAALRFLPEDLKNVVSVFMQKYNRTGVYGNE